MFFHNLKYEPLLPILIPCGLQVLAMVAVAPEFVPVRPPPLLSASSTTNIKVSINKVTYFVNDV
jgi:hypothetical protein